MNNHIFIIAEIGTAHQGDLKKAEKLIRAASASGADCAKFQVVFADEIIHPLTGTVPLPGGDTPLYDVFKKLEKDISFYRTLKDMTESEGMTFMASPFGKRSASILNKIGSEIFKIASPELNHYPLLEQVRSYGKKIILSTGVSMLGDIEKALHITGRENTSVLHCVTAYPAPVEQYNLKLISLYKQIFAVNTGISDHSTDPTLVPLLAAAMGASIIEKHFTLSNESNGLDDPIALNPENFTLMVKQVRSAEHSDPKEIINTMKEKYSSDFIEKIIGSGEKELAPAERENYGRTNRSIHALVRLKKGTILSDSNCAILRTEKVLHPGISPLFFSTIQGKEIKNDVADGEGIQWSDLL